MSNGIKVVEGHEQYNAAEGLRATNLKLILEAPKLYKWYVVDKNPKKETDALRFGNIAHAALLEPDKLRANIVIEPKFSGTGMRKAKEDWLTALKPGAMVLDEKESENLIGMMDCLSQDPDVKGILEKGVPEMSFYWDDDVTGLRCKARPDFVTEDGWVVNFKTAADATMKGFHYAIQDMAYHLQAANYCVGYKQVFGKDPQGYIWIVVEKKAPWLSAIYVADEALMEIGLRDYRYAVDLVTACMKAGEWPGYQFNKKTGERTGPQNICVPYGMLLEDS